MSDLSPNAHQNGHQIKTLNSRKLAGVDRDGKQAYCYPLGWLGHFPLR
jgi:hypothetical protein